MRRWTLSTVAVAGGLAAMALIGAVAATTTSSGYQAGSFGYDVSWPQCGGALPSNPGFAIVGVTGGKSFDENPCLAQQVSWARGGQQAPSLYINTNGAPKRYTNAACGRRDEVCRNREYGREAAAWAVAYANQSGAGDITRYWLDVETANSWSRKTAENRAALDGFIVGLEEAGKQVMGVYSTSYQWGRITGNWAPGLDNWVPQPGIDPSDAAAACGSAPSFAGGDVVIVQWWGTYDENYVCP